VQLGGGTTHADPYLIKFDIETRNVEAVFDRFRHDMQQQTHLPPLGEAGRIGAEYTYRAIGPLLLGDEVRKPRAAPGTGS
jgi:hypothetical protein